MSDSVSADAEQFRPIEALGEGVLCESTDALDRVLVLDRDETARKYYGELGHTLPVLLMKEAILADVERIVVVERPSERTRVYDIDMCLGALRLHHDYTRPEEAVFLPLSTAR